MILFVLSILTAPLSAAPESWLAPSRIDPAHIEILDAGDAPFPEALSRRKDFRPAENLNMLPPGRSYWLRLELPAAGEDRILEVVSDLVQSVEFAFVDPAGRAVTQAAGLDQPFSSRAVPHRYFAFRVPPNTETVYLKVGFNVRQHLALDLWSEAAFFIKTRREQIIFGLYYGALGIMVLYNLFLFIAVRSASYLYYVLYILSFGFYQTTLNGISIEYLWPDSIHQDLRASFFFAGAALFFSSLFTWHFLGVRRRSRVFNILLLGYAVLCLLWMPAAQLLPYQASNVSGRILGIAGIFLILSASIWALRDGFRPARYFLIAWALFLIGTLLFLLTGLGVIPRTPVTRWSMQIGSVLEVFLLSLALGDRINVMRSQKEYAVMRTRSISEELSIAGKIQNTILPPHPPETAFSSIAVRYRPAAELGGDFYDFQEHPGGVSVLVADVCGHGVPAALIASMIKMSFAAHSQEHAHPDALLSAMNAELGPRVGGKFITAAAIFLEPSRVTYSCAGHPPLLIYRPREKRLFELRMRGPVIGWKSQASWPAVSFDLEPEDRLLLYTDGLFESRNRERELFGFARLHGAVSQHAGKQLDDFTDALLREADQFRAGRLEDDVTLIVLEMKRETKES